MGFLPHREANSHITAHRLSKITTHFHKTAKWQTTSLHICPYQESVHICQ